MFVYVLVLIVIGVFLIMFNFKAVMKERDSFSYNLSHADGNMKEFEVKLGKLKREFSETILELQSEIQELRDEFSDSQKKPEEIEEESMKNFLEYDKIETKDKMGPTVNLENSVKIDEIKKMLDQGLSIDEVAEKLSLGKGEVLLIRGLYIK